MELALGVRTRLIRLIAESIVDAPFSTRNMVFQFSAEYTVNRVLPSRYGIVNLSGGTSPSVSVQPTAMNTSPSMPIIIAVSIQVGAYPRFLRYTLQWFLMGGKK